MNYKKRCVSSNQQVKRHCQMRRTYSSESVEDDGVCDKCISYCVDDGYPSLATVYPAKQCWENVNSGCEGFVRGTIFAALDKPFMGDKCKNGGKCR